MLVEFILRTLIRLSNLCGVKSRIVYDLHDKNCFLNTFKRHYLSHICTGEKFCMNARLMVCLKTYKCMASLKLATSFSGLFLEYSQQRFLVLQLLSGCEHKAHLVEYSESVAHAQLLSPGMSHSCRSRWHRLIKGILDTIQVAETRSRRL